MKGKSSEAHLNLHVQEETNARLSYSNEGPRQSSLLKGLSSFLGPTFVESTQVDVNEVEAQFRELEVDQRGKMWWVVKGIRGDKSLMTK